jgi:hypothetical protein
MNFKWGTFLTAQFLAEKRCQDENNLLNEFSFEILQ